MTTTFDPPVTLPPTIERMPATPTTTGPSLHNDAASAPHRTPLGAQAPTITPASRRVGVLGLLGLRLAVGFEFLWAFLDKTFGLGYSTPSGRAWIHGGSPTSGFLSGVNVGPFQSTFHNLAGVTAIDWLFMLGLLGVGAALVLGIALRPAAISGSVLLAMMYLASWPFAKIGGGQPTGSVNPIVDDHIVSIVALIAIAGFAAWNVGFISRRWSSLPIVRAHSWLR
jgi:thiosulfate dehydrogenase (quinone) large subunit